MTFLFLGRYFDHHYVRLFFEDDINRAEWESCETIEKHAGRIEKRICRKATEYFLVV